MPPKTPQEVLADLEAKVIENALQELARLEGTCCKGHKSRLSNIHEAVKLAHQVRSLLAK